MTQDLDILSFDAVADSEAGSELELMQPDGQTSTGIFLTIIGKHADAVTQWQSKLMDKKQREAMLAHKSGKPAPAQSAEERNAMNIEGTALRVTGWRGVKQEFSQDLLRKALARNPHWIPQILDHSEDVGNFSQKQ